MRRWGFAVAVLLALLIAAPAAQAQFPGTNGPILFIGSFDGSHVLYSVEPDGTGLAPTGEIAYGDTDPTGHGSSLGQSRPAASPSDGEFVYVEHNHAFDEFWENLRFHSGAELETCGSLGFDPVGNPAWSPDAKWIVFQSAYYYGGGSCDGDGSSYIRLYNVETDAPVPGALAEGGDPDWSPDGTRIAYEGVGSATGIWTMNSNGTGRTFVTNGKDPSWSPDGSKILLADADGEIYVVSKDGTGRVRLTCCGANNFDPVWSPDGTKIVYVRHWGVSFGDNELWTMNPDGSGRARLPIDLAQSRDPSWDSIPVNAYPRPKAASPMDVSLVPAHATCGSPNRQHAAPLSHGSCAPPQQSSGQLTVGTPDANSQAASSVGSVRLKVVNDDGSTPADEADVQLLVNVTDVRRKSNLADYTGELRLSAIVRATDKLNQPSPTPTGLGAATLGDTGFGPPIPCSATSDPAIGSTCAISTTVDALIPGLVLGGARSVWQFDQVRLYDGGPDEDGDTTGDNTVFLTQGVFVP